MILDTSTLTEGKVLQVPCDTGQRGLRLSEGAALMAEDGATQLEGTCGNPFLSLMTAE
jgi:hypothetical protein